VLSDFILYTLWSASRPSILPEPCPSDTFENLPNVNGSNGNGQMRAKTDDTFLSRLILPPWLSPHNLPACDQRPRDREIPPPAGPTLTALTPPHSLSHRIRRISDQRVRTLARARNPVLDPSLRPLRHERYTSSNSTWLLLRYPWVLEARL
jgi:hypothetical protein